MSAPILVTGLPRSGTSWTGRMLTAGGGLVYVNEPLNPQHPPGRCPGVLNAEVTHRFQYICRDNEDTWLPAFRDTVALRYRFAAELRRNRSPYDLARLIRYGTAFTAGRLRHARALLDDPFAVLSAGWFADRLGCRVIVLRRDPVSFVASWQRLGWTIHFRDLLDQPLLVRDHPEVAELSALADSTGRITKAATLWRLTATITARLASQHPGIQVVQYEDLARDPLGGFHTLYDRTGLNWSPRAEKRITQACTAPITGPQSPFAWSGLSLSRTAYRRTNSHAAAHLPPNGLTPTDITHIRTLCS
ncbi:sulfotransferase family protein [Spongiactinospora rosea]|uniref:Sulfotransferase family protein n=1 Tax=Spongiactinospora rosea TaxID=2248750 RepID=A0A366LZB8_9ACTN|nr:sulfotransferase [Spongiactinospora rosea]RBQ18709.1 sulfotransferase family protein [Spongiactinospora rosea]